MSNEEPDPLDVPAAAAEGEMTNYFWDPETDTVHKAKYDIVFDPRELWEPELIELQKNLEKNLRVGSTFLPGIWISTVFLGIDISAQANLSLMKSFTVRQEKRFLKARRYPLRFRTRRQ